MEAVSRCQKGTRLGSGSATLLVTMYFLPFFLWFLLVSQVCDISSGTDLPSHWLEDFANFTPTAEDNDQYDPTHTFGET